MQTQNETTIFSPPDGTRCIYCLKMSDAPMIALRPYDLKTGRVGATVFACVSFGECAARRHNIRRVSR